MDQWGCHLSSGLCPHYMTEFPYTAAKLMNLLEQFKQIMTEHTSLAFKVIGYGG